MSEARWRAVATRRPPDVLKAFAYVTRNDRGVRELLVFHHPNPLAGVQVPKGTVEPNEAPEAAARREAFEECGLGALELVGHLATDVVHFPNDPDSDQVQQRRFYHFRTAAPTPDAWEHVVSEGVQGKGMTFHCCWVPLADDPKLVANMGDYLHLVVS